MPSLIHPPFSLTESDCFAATLVGKQQLKKRKVLRRWAAGRRPGRLFMPKQACFSDLFPEKQKSSPGRLWRTKLSSLVSGLDCPPGCTPPDQTINSGAISIFPSIRGGTQEWRLRQRGDFLLRLLFADRKARRRIRQLCAFQPHGTASLEVV